MDSIFEKAKKKAQVLFEVSCNLKKLEKAFSSWNRRKYIKSFLLDVTGFSVKRGRFGVYNIMYDAKVTNGHKRDYFYINDSGTSFSKRSSRKLSTLESFNEELDFQLSTIYDDNEKFNYYFCSVLYSLGFRGAIYKNLHWNTLRTVQKYTNELLSRTT